MKKRGKVKNIVISNSSNSSGGIRDDSSFRMLKLALKKLQEKYNVRFDDLKALLEEKPERLVLPISIFDNTELSAFEIICKYLKEERNLRFSAIASLLNRNHRTVWTTYSNAVRKQKKGLVVKESAFEVPVEIFSARKFSVLELLVSYLKDHYNLSFAQISSLLHKDPRNVWTVYSRFKKKKR